MRRLPNIELGGDDGFEEPISEDLVSMLNEVLNPHQRDHHH